MALVLTLYIACSQYISSMDDIYLQKAAKRNCARTLELDIVRLVESN